MLCLVEGDAITHDTRPYDGAAAWRRAIVYALVCIAIAAVTGVLADLVTDPGLAVDEPWWWAWTALCLAVVVVGYWVVWPMGTWTHGRDLHRGSVLTFGAMWGVAEGLLFASVLAVSRDVVSSDVAAVVLAFVVISAYLGLWHAFYWDIKVAPDHNDPAWNARKVLLVHVPNLLVTLPYLAVWDSVLVFVLLQVVALVGASWTMRMVAFPGWRAVVGSLGRGSARQAASG